MKAFQDNAKRTWLVTINVAAVKRCRALVGVDLYGLVGGGFEALKSLLADPVQLVDTLYVLCKAEADRQGITDEAFAEALGGDALDAATQAFVEELVDFFPDPRVRESFKGVIDAGRRVKDAAMDRLIRAIPQIDIETEATKLIGRFGTLPAGSGSTQGRSPSANSH